MPTKRHTYSYPTRIEYGPGAVNDLVAVVQQAGYKRGLLVTDEGIVKAGSPEKISNRFKTAGIEITTFSAVKSNPTDDNAYDGTKVYKESKSEFISAVAGFLPLRMLNPSLTDIPTIASLKIGAASLAASSAALFRAIIAFSIF